MQWNPFFTPPPPPPTHQNKNSVKVVLKVGRNLIQAVSHQAFRAAVFSTLNKFHSGSIFSYRNTQDLFINPPTGAACILWPCRRSSLLTSAPSSAGLLAEASSPSPSPSSAVSRVSPACFCSQLSSAHTATQRQPYTL